MSEETTVVKVKFKGKFSLGQSQRYPAANVSDEFFSNLTDLNILVLKLSNLPAPSNKKGASDVPPTTRSKKRSDDVKPADVPPASLSTANKKQKVGSEASKNKINTPDISNPEERDTTVGILTIPQSRDLESQSAYYGSAQNAKMFAKALVNMDPAEMDVKCDFDFWVWLEAQKYFHPYSNASHDVQVLALQDIGENNPWLLYLNSLVPESLPSSEPDSSSGPVIDVVSEALTSKNKELIKVNLQLNRLIANIRRQLQTPEVRNEQSTTTKNLEKDKSIISKWSKTKKKHK